MNELKTCKCCKQTKPLEFFYSTFSIKYKRTQYQSNCKDCYRAVQLQKRYGVDELEYNKQLARQNHSCMICGVHHSTQSKALQVDHDHSTGKLRGILCGKCNRALGLVNDNVETLTRMIKYLQA